MTTNNKKLDIFQTLNSINRKDKEYFHNLTEEERKAFPPYVIMRWLTGTSSGNQILFVNELVNPFVFSLQDHKELLYDLMTICAIGRQQRYNWIKGPSKKTGSTPNVLKTIGEYYGYSHKKAREVLPLLTTDDILQYAEQLGYQKDEITKIKKELREIKANESFEI